MVSAAGSPVHDNWKQVIVDAAETDTVFLNQRHSPALLALHTDRTEALVDAAHDVFGDFGDAQALYFGGDMNAAIALTGQVAGRIDAVRTVATSSPTPSVTSLRSSPDCRVLDGARGLMVHAV